MKKRKYLLTSALLFSTLGLAMTSVSCNNNNTEVVEKTHKVNCETSNDYSITTDVAEAKKGDTVIITVSVTNTEKVLDKVLVNNSEEGVEVISKGSKYSFVMGEEDITLSATLTDKVYENKTLSVNAVNGFNVTFKVGEKAVTEAKKGDTVNVFIENTTEDRRFKSLTSTDVTLNTVKEGEEYSFLMIDNNVALTLEDEAIPTHNLAFTGSTGMSAKFFYKGEEVVAGIEGKEITVKVTLENKYAFDSLTSTTEGVNLTVVKEGEEYTFIMPKTDVALTGECHKVEVKYKVLNVQGVYLVGNIQGVSKDKEIVEGSEVTFTFSLTNGTYEPVSKYEYGAYINNELVMATVDATNKTGYLTFTMPSEDVSIYVGAFLKNDESATNKFTVKVPEISTYYKIFGILNGVYANDYGSIKIYVACKKGSVVKSVKYSKNGETPINISSYSGYYTVNKAYKDGDILTYSVETEVTGVKKVTFEGSENFDVVGDLEATVGTKVTYKITPKNGYQLLWEGAYYSKSFVESITPTTEGVSKPSASCDQSDNSFTFTMPNSDVTIKLKLAKTVSLTYEASEFIEKVEFAESSYTSQRVTEMVGGSTCYVFVTVKDGYKINKVFYKENEECKAESSYSGTYYTFKVPTDVDTVKLTFDVTKLMKFIAATTNEYEIYGLSSNYIAPGETVSFEISRKTGYKINSVSLSDGTAIAINSGSNTKYSFTMPTNDVSLVVDTTNVGTSVITIDKKDVISSMTVKDYLSKAIFTNEALTVGETITISGVKANLGFSVTGFTLSTGGAVTYDETTKTYSFVVPSEAFTLIPTYVEEQSFALNFAENSEVTAEFKDNYTKVTKGYVGHTIQVNLNINSSIKNDKYVDSSTAKVITASGTEVKIIDTTDYNGSSVIKFVMPSEDVTISVSAAVYQKYEIKKAGNLSQYLYIHESRSDYSAENETLTAKAGTKLYASFNIPAETYSQYKKVNLVVTNDTDGETVYSKLGVESKDYWPFTVPTSNCTVTLEGTN